MGFQVGNGMTEELNTHNLVVDFGKHKGTLWTRLPVNYLKWLANQTGYERPNSKLDNKNVELAKAELKRRGTVTPRIDISTHAINRASLHLLNQWSEREDRSEGLYSWLERIAVEAMENKPIGETNGRILYMGICFVFEADGNWPVLKTVFPKGESHKQ